VQAVYRKSLVYVLQLEYPHYYASARRGGRPVCSGPKGHRIYWRFPICSDSGLALVLWPLVWPEIIAKNSEGGNSVGRSSLIRVASPAQIDLASGTIPPDLGGTIAPTRERCRQFKHYKPTALVRIHFAILFLQEKRNQGRGPAIFFFNNKGNFSSCLNLIIDSIGMLPYYQPDVCQSNQARGLVIEFLTNWGY